MGLPRRLAGGAFGPSTVVGLVVPGVPTMPFLLTSSYFLARSSPRLDARLRRTVFLGPILQEWEFQGGLSRLSKGKLAALTLSIIALTVILAPLSPITLVLVVLIASVSLVGILEMPGLPTNSQPALQHDAPARLALPSP